MISLHKSLKSFTQFAFKVIHTDNNLLPSKRACGIDRNMIESDAPDQSSVAQIPSQSLMATAGCQTTALILHDNENMKFIGSLLDNIRNAEIKVQAKLEIGRNAIAYSAEDVM